MDEWGIVWTVTAPKKALKKNDNFELEAAPDGLENKLSPAGVLL